MLVYRLGRAKYIRDLSGTGAQLNGGRWNREGTPMLYTSDHCSLALLEVIVNTPQKLLPVNFRLLKLFISNDLETAMIHPEELPDNWQQYPAPDILADIGSEWVKQGKCPALKVPSVLVPDEWNVLINPQHQDFEQINIESVSPFQIDSRF